VREEEKDGAAVNENEQLDNEAEQVDGVEA
jgi:hypothetical protein